MGDVGAIKVVAPKSTKAQLEFSNSNLAITGKWSAPLCSASAIACETTAFGG